jgi:hypothetical protein
METQYHKTNKCSATGKTRYYDQSVAKEAMLRIKAKQGIYNGTTKKRYKHRQGKPDQCRYYYCKHCKGYHLTSSNAHVTQTTIEKKFQLRVKKTNGLIISSDEAQNWKADSLPFPELK